METVYLALGSNLGDRQRHLRAALDRLAARVRIDRVSPIYRTAPLYVLDQPEFLNLVVVGATVAPALELLAFVKALETDLGRTPGLRFGPRVIDIDILILGAATVDLPELEIPHPRLAERAFVLAPLADLAPGFRHPRLGLTIAELLAARPDRDSVIRLPP